MPNDKLTRGYSSRLRAFRCSSRDESAQYVADQFAAIGLEPWTVARYSTLFSEIITIILRMICLNRSSGRQH